ncbi:MAG TPA: DNA recombination protein RmuC [Candidatus Didemnitutus sp.]|nr:DNA recombination protein RmuC [Candidatus Didemnitutus sp.]
MDLLIALASLVVGGAAGWFIARSRSAALTERARMLAEELESARRRVAELETLRTQAEAALAADHAAAAEKIAQFTEERQRMLESFKAISQDALKLNNQAFLDLARQSFSNLHQQATGDLEKRQQAIDAMVKPIRESLDKVDGKIGEIEKARAEAYGKLSEQLKSLGTAQTQLQAEANKLSVALRSTTTAGTWGELQLRRVVEMSGMSSYCDFVEQESSGSLRADMVIRLPGGQQLVVDAKAPNDAYREAANATDEAVRAARLADHAAKVRTHIDALGAKNYWEQFQPSPEFVILFLPGDQFLSGALQADPTLIDRAIARKVLLATPATLIALLKAAAYGWRQEDISKNAQFIGELGRELHDRVAVFADHLENVGSALKSAVTHYNKALGSYETNLLSGARKLAEHGAKGAKEIAEPDPIEVAPRDLVKRN